MLGFFRRPKPRNDGWLSESELAEMREQLKFSLLTWLGKIDFMDEQLSSDPRIEAVIHGEDKRSLAIGGIDPILDDFMAFMRTKVRRNGTAD